MSITVTELQRFQPNDGLASDLTGTVVSMSENGEWCAVGSPENTTNENSQVPLANAGAVYMLKLVNGQYVQKQKIALPSSIRIANNYFGSRLKLSKSGKRLFVGTPHYSFNVSNGGLVSIYDYDITLDKWVLLQHVGPQTETVNGRFGWAIDCDFYGLELVASQPYNGGGNVHVFKIDPIGAPFVREKILTISGSVNDDEFGHALAMSGDGNKLFATESLVDDSGIVLIYEKNGSNSFPDSPTKLLADPNRIPGDQFGFGDDETGFYSGNSITCDFIGENIFIEIAKKENPKSPALNNTGLIAWYTRNLDGDYKLQHFISATDRKTEDSNSGAQFAYSISTDREGRYLLVGKNREDFDIANGITDTGSAYLYKRDVDLNGFTLKLLPEEIRLNARYGFGVDISYDGEYFVIGANRLEIANAVEGGAYFYKLDDQAIYHPSIPQQTLLDQFKNKVNINKFFNSINASIQEIEHVLFDLIQQRSLFTATGVQLDLIGDLLGIERNGRTDEDYRKVLIVQTRVNTSGGTPEDIIFVAQQLSDATIINLTETFPAIINLFINDTISQELLDALQIMKPAGVSLNVSNIVITTQPLSFAKNPIGLGWSEDGDLNGGALSEVV